MHPRNLTVIRMRVDATKMVVLAVLPFLMAQSDPEVIPQIGELEREFAQAERFEFLRTISDIPEDARRFLLEIFPLDSVAELGEYVELGDMRSIEEAPTVQHVYSAISEDLFVFLFYGGGVGGPYLAAIVFSRRSLCGAIYLLGNFSVVPSLDDVRRSISRRGRYEFPILSR